VENSIHGAPCPNAAQSLIKQLDRKQRRESPQEATSFSFFKSHGKADSPGNLNTFLPRLREGWEFFSSQNPLCLLCQTGCRFASQCTFRYPRDVSTTGPLHLLFPLPGKLRTSQDSQPHSLHVSARCHLLRKVCQTFCPSPHLPTAFLSFLADTMSHRRLHICLLIVQGLPDFTGQ
jgi:hypothetical protein